MRLSLKLALATTLGVAMVLGAYSFLRIRREARYFEEDMRRDHRTLAQALALGASVLARRSGPDEALAFIEESNAQRSHVHILWVDDRRVRAASGGALAVRSWVDSAAERGEHLVTRVPLRLDAGRAGFIEIRESLANRETYLRGTLVRHVIITCVLVLLCGSIILAGGSFMLGRPLRPLLDKLHRIGGGDWSGPLGMRQRDEIGTIAREVDAMCERLSDLHARAEREAEARIAALEQLRHADRLGTVGMLASGVAHELGTPLNVVAASARMIERGHSEGDDAKEDARVIVDQTERMTRIIRQLLDFARRRHPKKSAEPLEPLVDGTLHLLEGLASKSSVRLARLDGDAILAPVDAVQIQQVFTNLVVNAIQAQPSGGEVRVRIARSTAAPPEDASRLGPHAAVEIEDDGPGIAPEVLGRVFEPFYTTKDVGEGTGLGLSVAYGIVRDHGGWIAVKSERGRGSRFEVHLPIEPGAPAEQA